MDSPKKGQLFINIGAGYIIAPPPHVFPEEPRYTFDEEKRRFVKVQVPAPSMRAVAMDYFNRKQRGVFRFKVPRIQCIDC